MDDTSIARPNTPTTPTEYRYHDKSTSTPVEWGLQRARDVATDDSGETQTLKQHFLKADQSIAQPDRQGSQFPKQEPHDNNGRNSHNRGFVSPSPVTYAVIRYNGVKLLAKEFKRRIFLKFRSSLNVLRELLK